MSCRASHGASVAVLRSSGLRCGRQLPPGVREGPRYLPCRSLPLLQKGPCQLCGAAVATSWRKLPATVPQAVGTMACERAAGAGGTQPVRPAAWHLPGATSTHPATPVSGSQHSHILCYHAGNPCYVYLSKRAKDEPETLDEALALCRAAKRPCRSVGNASSGSEVSREGSVRAAGASMLCWFTLKCNGMYRGGWAQGQKEAAAAATWLPSHARLPPAPAQPSLCSRAAPAAALPKARLTTAPAALRSP